MPKVSIVVPVYNVKLYIEKCIVSVVEQTYRDFELLIIDDASKDNSISLIEPILSDTEILWTIISHRVNLGVGAARNTGIEYAKGEFLVFLDSDDYLEPNALERYVKSNEDSGCEIIFSRMMKVYPDSTLNKPASIGPLSGVQTAKRVLEAAFFNEIDVYVINVFAKRALFGDKIRFPSGIIFEESFVVPYLLNKTPSALFLTDILYNYRQRPGSLTRRLNKQNATIIQRIEEMQDKLGLSYQDELLNAYRFFKVKMMANICQNITLFADDVNLHKSLFYKIRQVLKGANVITVFSRRPNKERFLMLIFAYCPKLYIGYFRHKRKKMQDKNI